MKRRRVTSSSLRSVGYDESAKILEIESQNGRVYRYYDVPRDVYEELMNAESLGSYFVENIRDNFRYSREA